MTTTIEVIVAGTTYELTDDDPFRVESVELWGMAPGHLLESRGAEQHGTTIEGFRLDPRDLELIIGFSGEDADLLTAKRALLSIFQRRTEALTMRFTLDDGTVRDIDGHFLSGLTFVRDGKDHNAMRTPVVIHCGDPTFYDPSGESLTFELGGGSGSGVVPLVVPMAVGASTIDATTVVTYAGTWRSAPSLIRITGPITEFVLTNTTTGDVIAAKTGVSIAAGHYVDLDCRYGHATALLDGATNWIANLADANDLTVFHFAAAPEAAGGENSISLTGSGVTDVTNIQISYLDRYIGA